MIPNYALPARPAALWLRRGVGEWLGRSSPEITRRVYSYPMAKNNEVGQAAVGRTTRKTFPAVYPSRTEGAGS